LTDLAIVGTSHGRPNYLQESFRSWEKAGWDHLYRAWFIDPNGRSPLHEVEEKLCHEYGVEPFHNEQTLGPLGNPFKALSHGFEQGANFVVLAEDDSTVAEDAVEYFEWAANKFQADDRVMFVCAFQKHRYDKVDSRLRLAEYRAGYHSPTIWGLWRDRWERFIRDTWDHDYSHNGWDWNFGFNILPSTGRGSIVPLYSRSDHIGKYGGAHCTPDMFEGLKAPQPVYAQSTDPWTLTED